MVKFTARDLRCICCGLENATPKLLDTLNAAQEIYGEPFTVKSGSRCLKHNTEVGGVPTSAHVSGEAADIAVYGSWRRKKLMKALDSAGFPRIGMASVFLHADVSATLVEGWWVYQ